MDNSPYLDKPCLTERERKLADSLSWIVEFCNDHPEWFGEGNPSDGAEYEWLDTANELLRDLDS